MNKERVLVVDDELLCSYFLSSSLEEEGYEVRSAATGDEAIETGADFNPQVLVTDWMLKEGKDGVEIAKALHGRNPDLKIIFITGMAAESIEERLAGIPYLAILEKPVDLEQIVKLIRKRDVPAYN